jgi:hypothetical protein
VSHQADLGAVRRTLRTNEVSPSPKKIIAKPSLWSAGNVHYLNGNVLVSASAGGERLFQVAINLLFSNFAMNRKLSRKTKTF